MQDKPTADCGDGRDGHATQYQHVGAAATLSGRDCARSRGRAAGLLLAAPAPGGVDKQPDSLVGDRLVEESVDRAVRDLRGERTLVIDAARDDEDEIGKLRPQALGDAIDRPRHRARIENRNASVLREQVRGELGLVAHRKGVVFRTDSLQRAHQRLVARERDDAFAGRRAVADRSGQGRIALEIVQCGAARHQ